MAQWHLSTPLDGKVCRRHFDGLTVSPAALADREMDRIVCRYSYMVGMCCLPAQVARSFDANADVIWREGGDSGEARWGYHVVVFHIANCWRTDSLVRAFSRPISAAFYFHLARRLPANALVSVVSVRLRFETGSDLPRRFSLYALASKRVATDFPY